MEAPPGFSEHFKPGEACRLKKSLYGLKQSPRAWFGRFTLAMKRYLKGTAGHGVLIRSNGYLNIQMYTDADWAGDKGNRRSTSGYFSLVGGNLVTWRSKKQKVVSLSSAEAEFRVMHNQHKFAWDFPCNIECCGDHQKSHMKKRFCPLERMFPRFFGTFVTWLATDQMIDDAPFGLIYMVIKDLDLKPKVDAMMRDFLKYALEMSICFRKRFIVMLLEHQDVISKFGSSSRWEKLSMKMGTKILPSGDGSRGDCIGSSKFTIYEMRKGCSVWSSKYIVNTDDFMNPLPEGWSIRSMV
nr:putative reverse transcriptase, RNA-dependent DNA polymerase [Tanacetum cinerariifolium]